MSTPDNPQQPQYQQYPSDPSGAFAAPQPGGGYGQPVSSPRNGFGVTALVLGIIALVLCWTVWAGIVLGVLAIIFGVLGMKRANRGEATNKGASIAGLVTGIIGLVVGAVILIAIGSIFASVGSQLSDLQDCLKSATTTEAQQQCQQQFNDSVQNR